MGGVFPCLLVLLFAGAMIGGCKSLSLPGAVPRPGKDDAAIAEQVHTLIAQDPELTGSKIRVFVMEGNVSLSGTIANAAAKARLLDAVRGVSGVRSIGDNLEVPKAPG